jgi:hypothetical protein
MFLIPPRLDHHWDFGSAWSSISGTSFNHRIYILSWEGEADIKMLGKMMVELVNKFL